MRLVLDMGLKKVGIEWRATQAANGKQVDVADEIRECQSPHHLIGHDVPHAAVSAHDADMRPERVQFVVEDEALQSRDGLASQRKQAAGEKDGSRRNMGVVDLERTARPGQDTTPQANQTFTNWNVVGAGPNGANR